MPVDPRMQLFEREAEGILQHLHGEYTNLQTGSSHAALVEHVKVAVYGQKQELRTLAGISIQDARTIVIQPWDRGILYEVETALRDLDLGASPVNDGTVIRINLPPMTEERRKHLVKVVHELAEESRITVRQRRQDTLEDIKKNEKDEDARYTLLENLDEAVKSVNGKIDESKKKKEEEIMKI